jgi:hypothetical protein
MADTNPPEEVLPQGYQVGTTVVMPLPAERAYPLRELDFLTLCDGTSGSERAGRDLYIGLFISAAVGIAGVVSAADWKGAFGQQDWWILGPFLVLVIMAAGSAVGCVLHWKRMGQENTPYTRLKQAILDFFELQSSATS